MKNEKQDRGGSKQHITPEPVTEVASIMACRQACNCLRAKSLGSRGVSSVVNGGGNYVSRRSRKQEQRQLIVGVPIVVGSVTARKVRRKQIARSGMLSFSSDNRQNDWGDKEHNTVSSSSSSLSSETAPNSSVDNDAAAPDGLVGSKSGSRGQAKAAAGGGEEAAASKGKIWHFDKASRSIGCDAAIIPICAWFLPSCE